MRKTLSAIILFMCIFIVAGCSGESSTSQDTSLVQISPGSAVGSVFVANTALQLGESTSVSATFTKSDGTPASGINVNFSTTLGSITPASGIVATNASGIATVQLTAGTISGQGQVTASATIDNKQITKTGLFSVSLPSLKLSAISLGLSNLSYGGSTSVSVTVTDASGATYTGQEVDVTFSSTQAASGKAAITSPVRTVNGVATVTYQAITATGNDTITATITGDSKTATINISPLAASSISFVSASPKNIGLKGMGGTGVQETSLVTFRVFDTAGQPKPNQQVDFALNTTVGGLSISSASGSTAADGTVSTIVQSGIIATSVRVTATLRNISPTIATQSDQLVVSTGVPAQDGLSVAIETLNPESLNTDGVVDKVTARLSDHFHNPVPDGTAVYFTTSGGSIQPSCTTTAGACTVNWTSQNPRPLNGRARILAYAVGEEAFLDLNGNGLADAGEFSDDSEAFRDDNENGLKDASETYIDFNSDGLFNGPDGKYNGVLQGAAYVGAPKSKHVFSNSTLVMASSAAKITGTCSTNIPLGSYISCSVTVSDLNGNTMPAATTVDFKLTTLISGKSGTVSTTLVMPTYDKYTFPNTTANSGVIFPITISDPSTTTSAIGQLEIKVTSPGGLVTTRDFQIN
ncbi:MAG: Ig-like domain-containing protein [Desulfuromonadaceae bacterium]|nr:Ig-like domain-containing protein [Desulfuromonadaceae bacterium]